MHDCLIDMDGTTFDYEGQLRRDLLRLKSPEENFDDDTNLWDESKAYLKERMSLIKSIPGWWENLPKLQLGWDVVDIARDLGFRVVVLTKGPNSKSRAWSEKVECVQKHFGKNTPINIVGGHSKEETDNSKSNIWGRILVDDHPAYMNGWLTHRKRGLGIMPSHSYNQGFWHPQVIMYDGTNLSEVRRLMEIVSRREDKQQWLSEAGRDNIVDFESWHRANKFVSRL